MNEIKKVVVLGANGTMGAGAAALFAGRGYEVAMLARTIEKAEQGLASAKSAVRAEVIGDRITLGTYESDMASSLKDADLILEAVAERLDIKQHYFKQVDEHRKKGSVVATVSSGLSMDAMIEGRSDDFGAHFMGLHLFNPPNVIVGTEMIPSSKTDKELFNSIRKFAERRLGRVVIECRDKPAFAGNLVGFKVLNECTQLALEHGVTKVDYLIGPYTGRAMPPLATIDLVGWDVHKAIVDNVFENTNDEAHAFFAMPSYMDELLKKGHLGNKTPSTGGFYRTIRDANHELAAEVLDPSTGTYMPREPANPIAFVEEIKALHRLGKYEEAGAAFLAAQGDDAEIARRVVLGYVSYALNRVGDDQVVAKPIDVDLIMGYGFNWAPASVLVDLFGRDQTIAALQALDLPVPACVTNLGAGDRLFTDRRTNIGRYFING